VLNLNTAKTLLQADHHLCFIMLLALALESSVHRKANGLEAASSLSLLLLALTIFVCSAPNGEHVLETLFYSRK
jgi:hypothetical protein